MGKPSSKKEKPKNSNDPNRRSNVKPGMRTAATVKRLNIYKKKPIRDKRGKILHEDFQSKALPNTRIAPDRRWFGNTRVVGFKQLENFKKEMSNKVDDNFTVFIKQKKLPMHLLNIPEEKSNNTIKIKSFENSFGSKKQSKVPKVAVDDINELAQSIEEKNDTYSKRSQFLSDKELVAEYDKMTNTGRDSLFEKGQSKRIWKQLYNVIDSSDIIIQVLDSRDPLGTRSPMIEQYIKKNHSHKNVILLLNKCDLVPAWVMKQWLYYLSRSYPSLAFHASVSKPFGKAALLSVLRQLARLKSDKQSISVGLIGYPNVGKSSVINALMGKVVCTAASIPGETKVWKFITLMRHINLIDCPGVVHNTTSDSHVSKVLKGVIRIEKLEDPDEYILHLLKKLKPEYIKRAYQIHSWVDIEDFLIKVAIRFGKLLKGGEPDIQSTGRMILYDWQKGKLPYYEIPPKNFIPENSKETSSVKGDDVSSSQKLQNIIRDMCAEISYKQKEKLQTKNGYFFLEDLKQNEEDYKKSDIQKYIIKVEENANDNLDAEEKAIVQEIKSECEEVQEIKGEGILNDSDSDGYGEDGLEWQAIIDSLSNGEKNTDMF